MSYLPSPVTGYYSRVNNTVVSGNELLSYLTGNDIRRLEFNAARTAPPPLHVTGRVTMTPEQIIQAAISSLPVNCSTGTGQISVGVDSASQAASWVSILNLQSTNDVRVLRFHVASNTSGTTALMNTSGTSASVAILLNNAGAAATQSLFVTANGVGTAQSGVVGAERIVLVSASNLNSGAQVVNFNVLGNSL